MPGAGEMKKMVVLISSAICVAMRSSVFCSTHVSPSFPLSFFSRLLSSILLLLLSSLAAFFTFLCSSFLCFSLPYIPLSLCFFFYSLSRPLPLPLSSLHSLLSVFFFCLVDFFLFSLSVPFFPPVFSSSPLSPLSPFQCSTSSAFIARGWKRFPFDVAGME